MAMAGATAISAASSSSYMSLTSCVSIRSSSNNSSTIVSSPPSPSISTQKTSSQQAQRRKTLADQLQPLSTEFLEAPPPARVWHSPTRKKARDSVPQRRVKPSSEGSTISKVISFLTKEPDANLSSLLDSEVTFLTSKDIVAILNAQTRWHQALFFFEWAKSKSSFPINRFVYNVMLKILRKAEQWETGNALLEEMIKNDIAPDNITYSTIISFALRCNKTEEALSWFSRMQDAGCAPDSVTYSAVIDILVKADRMQEADDVCAKMQQDIKPWDSVVYSQIMKLHGLRNNFDQMWDVYKEMRAVDIFPNVVTYNTLISMLGNSGRSIQVVRLFNDMLSEGLKPSPVTLSLMFRTFSKTRDLEEAFKLFERIKEEEWVVDTVVFNSLLSLCAQMGRVNEGEKVYRELLASKECRGDDWTWRILVDMNVKGGRFEEAQKITKEMVGRGRSIDLPVYMNLIQGYGKSKDFKSVLSVMNDIKAANVPFDHMLAGALLSALVLCEEAGSEEKLPLVEEIGLVYPKLKAVIENLYKEESISTAKVKEDIRAMLNGAAEDCRRPFCNLLLDLCWMKQSAEQAQELLGIAILFGIYSELQIRTPMEWSLRLRTLSFGAARTALQGWVSCLRAVFQEEGSEIPCEFSIEVGLGLQSFPDDSVPVMSTVILKQVQELKAPFEESRAGWLTASAASVKDWLLGTKGSEEPLLAIEV
ncbi:hypothetical protein GOP47_0030341 [Adiantum capillus-veneris]|nr:hypothetical protein GOP47_0029767 [Adiantum capillus-veneris]KAI5055196.1 hypothetical protein GOP47_0030341 [Adiantum capillus-veneris]